MFSEKATKIWRNLLEGFDTAMSKSLYWCETPKANQSSSGSSHFKSTFERAQLLPRLLLSAKLYVAFNFIA